MSSQESGRLVTIPRTFNRAFMSCAVAQRHTLSYCFPHECEAGAKSCQMWDILSPSYRCLVISELRLALRGALLMQLNVVFDS